MKMTAMKILVLGDRKVGKSAVTVRFLTKRFIGEYYSSIDHLYRSSVRMEDMQTDVEILDTCSENLGSGVHALEKQVSWADAAVIVYSICSRQSFNRARQLFLHLANRPPPAYLPVLLLGNKGDLEHRREVGVGEGDEVALEHGCHYHEVSAAEGALTVCLAFQGLLREVRSVQQRHAALLKRRKSSLGSVGKMLGAMFGKGSSGGGGKDGHGERRTSFSSKEATGERRLSLTCGTKDRPAERRLSPSHPGKDSQGERRMSTSGKDTRRERWTSPPTNAIKDKPNEPQRTCVSPASKDGDKERRVVSPASGSGKDGQRKRRISPSSPIKQCQIEWGLFIVGVNTEEQHARDERAILPSGCTDGHRTAS